MKRGWGFPAVLCCLLWTLGGCAPLVGDPSGPDQACVFQTWEGTAEILRVTQGVEDSAVVLGGNAHGPRYLVEFRILPETSPSGSVVRRRTTPFFLSMGAGGLPDQSFLDRKGIVLGARLPVHVTEGFSDQPKARCGGIRIQFPDRSAQRPTF
ncbi:hypothetical protein SAMN02745704_00289 [Paucidesulfovibrio gracilis DSM 16080]|uniref:Lipoprotein n=1 Tax=Paucidesulfovibrio gracilis DSM 16080 TaxID=1121449 RepID=A0A1T4W468_9BACT|nr:hypothetical protein SAMN02745704_00289 [Paucidesulfovibrio gracilis DSM 16080]